MKEVIVFGTGSGGRKIKNMMQGLGFCVNAFVDNASDKQGILFEGIATYSPDYLHNNDFPIIIASVYEEEIKKQLEDMGVGERIIYREECTYRYIQEHLEEYDYIDSYKPPHTRDALTFVFGLDLGLFYGGIESWAYIFADALRDRGYQVKFITTTKSKPAPDRFHADTYYLDLDGEDYLAVVHATIQKILENTPCVLIDSWQNISMLVGAIIRSRSKNLIINMIEVVHNDLPRLYQAVKQFDSYIDYCLGVSRDISQRLVDVYQVDADKVRYKESPVIIGNNDRDYSENREQPIRIGYAARLVKAQKRTDLLIPIITDLINKKVNFRMQIAGTGSYEPILRQYIEQQGLNSYVTMRGFIPREQMVDFWKEQDVFINLSEYEGVGLCMLEAMGNGCVPIVTEVAGSHEFVNDHLGYICGINEPDEIVSCVCFLEENRCLLRRMGQQARRSIQDKCSVPAYIDHFFRLLNLDVNGGKANDGKENRNSGMQL